MPGPRGLKPMYSPADRAEGRFRRHTAARLHAVGGRGGGAVLAALFAAADCGRSFRVGAEGVTVLEGRDPAFFECETSGTTGAARVIRRSQVSWLASFAINAERFGIGPGMGVAVLGAPGPSLPLYASVEALCLGAELHALGGVRPDRALAHLAASGAELLHATPAQLRQLAAAQASRELGACPSVQHVLAGGGALDPATRAAARAVFPAARLSPYYGASETSFIAMAGEDAPDGSVGRAYPDVEIAVRGEDGRACAPGVHGEIWVRSPYLFESYVQGRARDTRRDAAGFLTLGEIGWQDAAGWLHVAGRRTRMVKVADTNVFLEAVEATLLGAPGVAEAAAVAVADARRGRVIVGFVSGAVDAAAVARHCRAALGPLAAPRRVVVLSALPCLGSGKADLAALARLAEGLA